jgi:excisionase family DNA binding protein
VTELELTLTPALLDGVARRVLELQRPRLAVSPTEAAELLGVSRNYFDEHILPELRVVRRGRRVLIAIAELERWLAENAARTLERSRDGDALHGWP